MLHSRKPKVGFGKSNDGHRLAWIDWVRFLASFSVVLTHARGGSFVEFGALPKGQQTIPTWVAFAGTRLGQESVLLFFVLSGFLVAGKIFDRVLALQFRPKEYAIDRVTRIAVPLIPALVFTYFVAHLTNCPTTWAQFIGNVLGFQGSFADVFGGNAPLWSLGFETWFYVIAGSAATLMTSRNPGILPISLFIAGAIVFSTLGSSFLLCWLIGGFAWRLRPSCPSFAASTLAIVLILLGVVVTQFNSGSNSIRSVHFSISEPTIRIVLALGYAILLQQIVLFPHSQGFWAKLDLLGTRLAASSYTLYLIHYPTLKLLSYLGWPKAKEITARTMATFGSEVVISLLVGFLFYRFFEANTHSVKKRIQDRFKGIGE